MFFRSKADKTVINFTNNKIFKKIVFIFNTKIVYTNVIHRIQKKIVFEIMLLITLKMPILKQY